MKTKILLSFFLTSTLCVGNEITQVAIKASGKADAARVLKSCGMTVVLDRGGKEELRNACRDVGLQYFRIYNVFCSYPKDHDFEPPKMISETGESPTGMQVSWRFFCPSREDIRKIKLDEIEADLKKLRPDGISLDFIRFFVEWRGPPEKEPDKRANWEDVPANAKRTHLRSFCFCAHCLNRFQKDANIKLGSSLNNAKEAALEILTRYKAAWKKWKCDLITSMVAEIRKRALRVHPKIQVMLHFVPWRTDEMDGALLEAVGQDPAALSKYADTFAPMVYHCILGRRPEWIESYSSYLQRATAKRVWPCIQATSVEGLDLTPFSGDSIRAAWKSVARSGMGGICLFGPSLKDSAGLTVVKELTAKH